MNGASHLAVLLLGAPQQEAPADKILPLLAAKQFVERHVAHIVPQGPLRTRFDTSLYKMHRDRGISSDELTPMITQLIRNYYAPPPCSLQSLPEAIVHKTGGAVSVRDMPRVLYVTHTDYQDDGWSCLYRSIFGAAALEKAIAQGTVLNHEQLGTWCREFRETVGIKGCIDAVNLQAKIGYVCSLLRTDGRYKLSKMIELLQQEHPDIKALLDSIQPDYFLVQGARALLRQGLPLEAVILLGKSNDPLARRASDHILNSVLRAIHTDSRTEKKLTKRAQELQKILANIYQPILELRALLVRMDSNLLKEALLVALDSGHVNLRKSMQQLSQQNPVFSALCQEVRQLAVCAIDPEAFYQLSAEIRFEYEELEQVLSRLCEADTRLKTITRLLQTTDDTQLLMVIALYSTSTYELHEVASLLKAHPSAAQFEGTWRNYDLLQRGIEGISQYLDNNKRDVLESIVASLKQVTEKNAVQAAVQLLTENALSEEQIRDARNLLTHLAEERVIFVLKSLVPAYPVEGVTQALLPLEPIIKQFAQLACPLTARALALLEEGGSLDEAKELIERGSNSYKNEALALLASDHTKGADWEIDERAFPHAHGALKQIKRAMAYEDRFGEREHMPPVDVLNLLGLERHNIHILGYQTTHLEGVNAQNHPHLAPGVRCDERELRDPILFEFSSEEQLAIERNEDQGEISKRVEQAIKEHITLNLMQDDQTQGAHHFICNIGNFHWIVISLVKFMGKKPILVVYDSKNLPVTNDSERYPNRIDAYIAYLFNTFLRPARA